MRCRVSSLALAGLLLGGCTIKLVNTSSEYRPVIPERVRLSCSCDLPETYSSPIVKVTLWKAPLTQKVEARSYVTDYSWLNRSLWLGLAGLSGYAAVHWWNYHTVENDTAFYTGRVLGILGAAAGLVGAFTNVSFFGPRRSESQRIFSGDTVYGTRTQFANSTVQVTVRQQGSAPVSQRTDNIGKLTLSARDFFDLPGADKGLGLDITAGTGLSATLSLPGAYLARAKAYDSAAIALFGQARKAEEGGRDEEALSFYSRVADTYPDATAASEATAKVQTIQQRMQAARAARVREELRRVSDDKVRSAMGALGLGRDEGDNLGRAIDGLEGDKAGDVIRIGLDMPLSNRDCVQEYGGLTSYQKVYAVLCYESRQGGDAVQGYMTLLGVSEPVAQRLASMDPKTMLR